MKLIKTIQNLVEEAEKEYNKVLESTTNMKEIERAEKNYFDSLKVLEKFNKLNGYKRNLS
jgi:lipoate synthase